jgi:hypothetical protein
MAQLARKGALPKHPAGAERHRAGEIEVDLARVDSRQCHRREPVAAPLFVNLGVQKGRPLIAAAG